MDVTLHSSFERLRTLRGNRQGDFYAYSLAAEYLPSTPFRGSVRFEQRQGRTLDKIVASGAMDFTLSHDLTFLSKQAHLSERKAGHRGSRRVAAQASFPDRSGLPRQ